MATITAITSSGTPLNVLDPSTWVGGVVPGPGDTAKFPDHPFQQRIYANVASDWLGDTNQWIRPWPASEDGTHRLRLFGNTGFPTVSGSVLIAPYNLPSRKYVKIDYDYLTGTSTSTFLYNARIDRTTNNDFIAPNWTWGTGSLEDPDSPYGWIQYAIYQALPYSASSPSEGGQAGPMMYEITGSGVWAVGKVEMGDHNIFFVKDQSKVQLCSATPIIDFHTPIANYSTLQVTDEATIEVSSSVDAASIIQSGIYMYQRGYNTLIISGSANYSSSLLSQTVNAGSNTIEIQDPTAFEAGDYISIEDRSEYYGTTSLTGSSPDYFYTIGNRTLPIGSYQDRFRSPAQTYTNSPDTNEVVRIESISGSTAVVSKKLGREGLVTHDIGTFSHREFAETFQERCDYFNGSKRVILADTNHHKYKKGDWLCISGSAYRVLHASSYLTQSQFIDFTDPAVNPKNVLVGTEYQYSGSDIPIDVTPPTWADAFHKYQKITSGSRGGIHSFYLDSASMSNSAQENTYLRGGFIVSGSYFKQGEIEISGSLSRDFTGASNINDALGVYWNVYPANREDFYVGYTPIYVSAVARHINGINVHGDSQVVINHSGIQDAAGESRIYADGSQDNYNDTAFFNSIQSFWGAGDQVTVKIVVRDNRCYIYVQGVLMGEWWEVETMGAVMVYLKRYASLFSVSIKERYDMLVLDTENPITINETIREGGLLETHQSGKAIKWWATEVEDELGFHNLMWDYWKQRGQTSIMPYLHSFTTAINTVGTSYPSLGCWSGAAGDFWEPAKVDYGNLFTHLPANATTVDGTWMVIDLGTDVEFDTVAVGMGYTGQSIHENSYSSYSGYRNRMRNISIQVSSTPDSWTTVRAAADDNRITGGTGGLRFYTFSGGPVTARFIKFAHTGGKIGASNSTNFKNFNFFGVYNQSVYPNQIRVKSTKNLRVGDRITFWSKQYGTPGNRNLTARSYAQYDQFSLNSTSTYSDYNTYGLSLLQDRSSWKITNISGDIITLDSPITTHFIGKGTMIMKYNRGNVSLDGAGVFDAFRVYFLYTQPIRFQFENCYIKGIIQAYNNNQSSDNIVTLRDVGMDTPVYSVGYYGNSTLLYNCVTNSGINFQTVYSLIAPQATIMYNVYTQNQSLSTNTFTPTPNADSIVNHCVYLNTANSIVYDPYVYTRNSVHGELSVKNTFFWGFDNNSHLPSSLFDDGMNLTVKWENNVGVSATQASNYNSTTTTGFKVSNKFYNILSTQNQYQWPNWALTVGAQGKMQSYNINYGRVADGQLIRDEALSANVPMVNIGGYNNSTIIIKNGEWYDVYASSADKLGDYTSTDLMCLFQINNPCTASIDLSFDYDVSPWQKHSISTDTSQQGYEYTLPIITVVNDAVKSKFGQVIGRAVIGNTSSTGSLDYFETFNFEPGEYRVLMNWAISDGSTLGVRAWSYKNMNFNILTDNVNNVSVSKNTWDIHKLLDSVEYDLNDFSRPTNIGAPTVVKVTNDVTTSVKFNKVKI